MSGDLFDCAGMLERMLGDEEIARIVCRQWLDDTPEELSKLAAALGGGAEIAAKRSAHSLKGSSRSVGCEAVGDVAGRIEEFCAAGKLEAAGALLDSLRDCFGRTAPLVDRFCGPA